MPTPTSPVALQQGEFEDASSSSTPVALSSGEFEDASATPPGPDKLDAFLAGGKAATRATRVPANPLNATVPQTSPIDGPGDVAAQQFERFNPRKTSVPVRQDPLFMPQAPADTFGGQLYRSTASKTTAITSGRPAPLSQGDAPNPNDTIRYQRNGGAVPQNAKPETFREETKTPEQRELEKVPGQIVQNLLVQPAKDVYGGAQDTVGQMGDDFDKRKFVGGLAKIVRGGSTLMLEADAPGLVSLGVKAVVGDAAAQVAVAKFGAYVAGGEVASQAVGAGADHYDLSPETKELGQAIAFFLPTLVGAGLTKAGFRAAVREDAAGFHSPGGAVRAGVRSTPEGYEAAAQVGGWNIKVRIPRPGSGNPAAGPDVPPTPREISSGETASAAESSINEANAVSTAAENIINPPPPPPKPPNPPGMDDATLTNKVLGDLHSAITSSPPEIQAKLALEAHGKLADWMLKTGRFIGPDGKLQIVDSPQRAASLAQQVLNDFQTQQAKVEQDKIKQREKDAAEQQKQAESAAKEQEKQAKEAQKAAEAPNENGLTPPEVTAATVKTIVEGSNTQSQAVAQIRRTLGVDGATAHGLIQDYLRNAKLEGGTDVGSAAEPTKEESRATIDKQMEALDRGDIDTVMLPKGSEYMPDVPEGLRVVDVDRDVPGAGIYITRLRSSTIQEAAKAGTHGVLLGHIESKEDLGDGQNTVVVQAVDPDGTVIQDSQVHDNPELIKAQAEALQERHPGANIGVATPEDVLAGRIAHSGEPLKLESDEFEVAPESTSAKEGGRGQSPELGDAVDGSQSTATPSSDVPKQEVHQRIPGHDGRETAVLLPEDEKLDARYRLVEHSSLVTSHRGDSFAINAEYPKGVQERHYDTDKEEQAKVIENARKYDPNYTINSNPDAVNGPPIITPNGIVLGGNSRAMTLGRVYGEDGGKAMLYRASLSRDASMFGFTDYQVNEMKNPVLVREVEQPATLDAMRRMGSAMNKSKTQALSPAAAAVSAGKNIKAATLSMIGDMLTAMGGDEPATLRELMSNAKNGRELLKMLHADSALTTEQRGGFFDKESGGLSEEGKTFVQRAIMGKILEDARLMEVTPKSIMQRLEASLGGLAVIASRDDNWNILPVIRSAVGDHVSIAKSGNSIEGHLAQTDMFGPARNPVVDAMTRFLDQKTTMVRDGFKQFAADSNLDVPGQGMMLMQPVEPHDAYNYALKLEGTEKQLTVDQFYDGLMTAAAEDPYEKQAEREGAFQRKRNRGLSSRKSRDEGGESPSNAGRGAKEAPTDTSARPNVVPAVKGSRVSVVDRDGVERTGTVAHSNELKTRVKTEDGEITVNTADVNPAAADAGKDSLAENPSQENTETNGDNSPTRTGSPASGDQSGGGRALADSGRPDTGRVGEVEAEAGGVADSGRDLRAAGEGDGAAVREAPASVPESRSGTGSGEGSSTELDNAPAGELIKAARAEAAKPAAALNRNWFSHPESWSPPSGTMGKLDGNIDALETLRKLEKEGRLATPEEQARLANYTGWGALAHAFNPHKAPFDQRKRWLAANNKLRDLLSPDELAAASRSTQNAHYTSPELVRYTWDLMKRLGFHGGNVIEPSMGAGNFFGMMPKSVRNNVTALGNELEPITAAIAKLLYPNATITNKDFKDLIVPDNSFDLAISNVPFGVNIYDPKYPKLNARIHDYFFVKSLDKVRPGGVVAFITSTGTMDKDSDRLRQIIGSKSDLIGAIRLPSGAFAKNAGTAVTTDLILLRKRAAGEQPSGPDWMKTVEVQVPSQKSATSGIIRVQLNEYFHKNPEMMLGVPGVNVMNGAERGFALYPHDDKNLNDLLEGAKQRIPKGIMLESKATGTELATTNAAYAPGEYQEGQYLVDDKGAVKQVIDGKMQRPEGIENADGSVNPAKMQRVKDMVGLRDNLNKLLSTMLDAPDDETGNALVRQQQDILRRGYEKFVKKNGNLNSSANRVFEDDPHFPRLLALENYDSAKKVTTPSDILTKRTIYPRKQMVNISSDLRDGLYQVLAERGYPDVGLMAKLSGRTPEELAGQLVADGLIFRSPNSGEYEMREKYLSGYVRDKLADARAAVKQGLKEFEPNVQALEAVQPEDIAIKDIDVKFGATWIPTGALQDFISDVLNTNSKVEFYGGKWKVSIGRMSAEATAEYGTRRAHAGDLVQESLNQREVTVYDTDQHGNPVLNQPETLLARQKQHALREAFNRWSGSSQRWAAPLAKIYNNVFNNLVLPEYDGSHLTFPGMSAAVNLRAHQKDAVWRIIQDGRGLLAHVVGAGKTFEMMAAIMEGRRIGAFRKAMMSVPNHLVGQTQSSFLQLYPGAKLLVPTKRDFEASNRKRFMARVAMGDHDAIIIAHSQFNLLDISPERQKITTEAILDEYEQTIQAMKASGEKGPTVKQVEKARDQLRAKLDKLKDLKADDAISFDKLGVDMLVIDEAHAYKNLVFVTKMQRIAGLAQGNSKRALRLKAKTEYLQDTNNGRGVVFATGTPLQNTMAEQYTMTRYVAPDVLSRAGIHYFDDWAANFGTVKTTNELAADGNSFKPRSRFSEFSNVPELMNMFRSFTDIKTAQMLNLPVPELEGGKPEANYIAATPELKALVGSLMDRAKAMQGKKVEKGGDNMLKIVSDGRKGALDMRLVDPNAEDDPNSKINQVVDDVLHDWKQGKEDKLTYLVFLDQFRAYETRYETTGFDGGKGSDILTKVESGVQKERLNLYDDMKAKWVKAGIPAKEIAYAGDYETPAEKDILFSKVNSGEIRILMGSTEKMGAGMNVQERLKVLHHVDLPWRPGDLAQRDGRIVRQGNTNKSVRIKYWLSTGSFDTFMLQALQTKATFIEQLMSGKYVGRKMQDLNNQVSMNLQDMKVATSGNPDVKLKYDLEQERANLLSLESARDSQVRQYAMSAMTYRQSAAYAEGAVRSMKASLAKYEAVKGKDGKGFAMALDGQKFTDRTSAGEFVKQMQVPYQNFHMELNGVGVAVTVFSEKLLEKALTYRFDFSDTDQKAPEYTMESLLLSMEGRLRNLKENTELREENAQRDLEKAAKLEELAKEPFSKAGRLAQVKRELAEVDSRLKPEGSHSSKDDITADVAEDEPDEPHDDDEGEGEGGGKLNRSSKIPKGGGTVRASLFGIDLLGEAAYKMVKSLYKEDIGPHIAKVATTGADAGRTLVRLLAPRAVANLDGLDAMMRLKGDLEKKSTELEYAMRGIKTMFDKLDEGQRIEFIDRMKTGQKQGTPELQMIADTYKSADTAMHHAVVESQIRNMDAKVQRFWRNLDAPNRAMFWNKVENGQDIERSSDADNAKKGDADAAIRMRLQDIADSTLSFKQDHFRVFWKTIPSPAGMLGFGVTKSPPQAGAKSPLAGDKGFLKQSTLKDISEGIARGGVPVTTNPQKLFELGQMSSLRFITANNMRQAMSSLGLRKFVKKNETPPSDWEKIDDYGDQVSFRAASGEGFVTAGNYYYEPSVARLIKNYLSRDLIRDTAIGRGVILFKNLSTAIELSISPFHLAAMSLQATASQIGLGIQMAWNQGIRDASLPALLKGAGLVGFAPLAPFTMSRTGGSAIKYIEDANKFLATRRGMSFVKQFGDSAAVAQMITDAFHGGLTLHMPRDYRMETAQSMREAWSKGNYLGALLRSPFAAATAAMKPLFEQYIPSLKMGMFLMQYAEELQEQHDALLSGKISRIELARKVVDMIENRFGELNFSNLFWDNTFKTGMQTLFRSVTWKLGTVRGAATALGPEARAAFADPLQAMRDDWKDGGKKHDKKDYVPVMGRNQAGLLGLVLTLSAAGAVISKLMTGKYPWDFIGEDENRGHSGAGALALETIHPRTGKTDDYTKLPVRITLPSDFRDFEHIVYDPKGYVASSLSGTVSHAIDSMENRDFFGNYVYDPNGEAYQKMAELFSYNMPQPITVQNYRDGKKRGDLSNFYMGMAGTSRASTEYDLTPAEKRMRYLRRAAHAPETPKQVDAYREKDADMTLGRATPAELRRAMKDGNLDYAEKMFKGMTYAQARDVYQNYASPDERRILKPMLDAKASSLLKRNPSEYRKQSNAN